MNIFEKKPIVLRMYYAQESWHKFINLFLIEYLNKIEVRNAVENWNISFSTHLGTHIKLVLYCSVPDLLKFKKDLKKEVRDFLSTHPSKTVNVEPSLNSFFIDFPNNSIWYDKDPERYLSTNLATHSAQFIISKCILDGLCCDEISDEDLFSFMVYMIFVLLKSYRLSLSEVSSIIQLTIDNMKNFSRPFHILNNELYTNFDAENRDCLSDIFEEVWAADIFKDELCWLNSWVSYCENNVLKVEPVVSFCYLCEILRSQLGLPVNLNNLINQAIFDVIGDKLSKSN